MFPTAHSQVYYNDEGEVLGWDSVPYEEEPYGDEMLPDADDFGPDYYDEEDDWDA